MQKRQTDFITLYLVKSWWVWVFLVACFGLYEQGAKKISHKIALLDKEMSELQTKYERALVQQEELSLQVASQNDPAWVELVLIRALGYVPEGSKKIYFREIEDIPS
jgi:hypothetical protein